MGGARTKSVTLRLELGINDKLDRYCADAALSKSLIVNSALSHLLRANEATRTEIVREYVKRAKRKG
jgi:predicted transcriptional regulator